MTTREVPWDRLDEPAPGKAPANPRDAGFYQPCLGKLDADDLINDKPGRNFNLEPAFG